MQKRPGKKTHVEKELGNCSGETAGRREVKPAELTRSQKDDAASRPTFPRECVARAGKCPNFSYESGRSFRYFQTGDKSTSHTKAGQKTGGNWSTSVGLASVP